VACARWHEENADDERAERVRQRVSRGAAGEAPTVRLDWEAARDAVGVQVVAIVEEFVRHIEEWARDAVRAHPMGIIRKCGEHDGAEPRDAIGKMARGP